MLGGIVQHVAEDLLHALAVRHDRRDIVVGARVADLDALLPEKLEIRVHRVLQLAGKVHALHAQREASVLHLGEFEQLLDHCRQAARFLQDDAEAALGLVQIAAGVHAQRLRPAADGRQRRSQLVGDRRDELLLYLFGLADLHRHIVDVVDQLAELVAVTILDHDAVAAARDTPCRVAHDGDGLDDVVDENGVRRRDEHHAHERRRGREQRIHQHPVLRLAQRRHIPQHAHHAGVEIQRVGHRKDVFPRLRVAPLIGCHLAADGRVDIARAGQRARRQSVGRDLHAPVRIDELQLDRILFLKGLGRVGRKAVILAVALHAVARKGLRRDVRAALKARAHRAVVVFLHADAEQRHRQHQQQQNGQRRAEEPALPKAADVQRRNEAFFVLRHGAPLPFVLLFAHTFHL